MLAGCRWLALEVKYLDRAQSFYEAFLDLDVVGTREGEVALAVGDAELVLRQPGTVPRGGLHTHYAMTVPTGEYDDWYDRLEQRFDLDEHTFGDARSLYFYDTEGNCVELGERETATSGVSALFEIVLEVEDIDRALSFYTDLGFETVDTGDERQRVRLTTGELDIELWEPHLGLADARGGVHVDFGVACPDPDAVADRVAEDARALAETPDGVCLRDPDGHAVTLVS